MTDFPSSSTIAKMAGGEVLLLLAEAARNEAGSYRSRVDHIVTNGTVPAWPSSCALTHAALCAMAEIFEHLVKEARRSGANPVLKASAKIARNTLIVEREVLAGKITGEEDI